MEMSSSKSNLERWQEKLVAKREAVSRPETSEHTYCNFPLNVEELPPPAEELLVDSHHQADNYGNDSLSHHTYASINCRMNESSDMESIYEPVHPRSMSQLSSKSGNSTAAGPTYSNLYPGKNCASRFKTLPSSNDGDEVDRLTDLLVKGMSTSSTKEPDYENTAVPVIGTCTDCNEKILGEGVHYTAMGKMYHINCLKCSICKCELQGLSFFVMDGKPCCEEDYKNTLEKCSVCQKPIPDRIIRATGKPYHPDCFKCIVCSRQLDGIPFTVDSKNQIYCIEDFHRKFAPRCCVCKEPIMPQSGQQETHRIVALDKSFHIECYRCEDCGLSLTSEAEGRGCYPLDGHIYCRSCNATRVRELTARKL